MRFILVKQVCREKAKTGFWCSLKSKRIDATHSVIELHREVSEVRDGKLHTRWHCNDYYNLGE